MITLFSAPKPFEGHIGLIQRNAIRSWLALGEEVEILLFGDEPGISQAASALGVGHVAHVERSPQGTPLLDSIFKQAQANARYTILCYVNADILLFPDLLTAAQAAADRFSRFCLVGQRWDLAIERALSAEDLASPSAASDLLAEAQRHRPMGSDYFVFPRGLFDPMPPFALGRAGWDNWMLYASRSRGAALVDASPAITAIHQEHDYSHLPGGQPHYRHPESLHNVALAGGPEMVFRLRDATWRLRHGEFEPVRAAERGWRRTVEAGLYTRLGPGPGSRLVRLLLHPVATLRYLFARLMGASDTPVNAARRAALAGYEAEAEKGRMVESDTPNRSNPHEV